MNMTDNDKELALRIAREVWGELSANEYIAKHCEFAHRYHTAKLEQAASGLDEWWSRGPHMASDTSHGWKRFGQDAYQAGAASQQPAIAALEAQVISGFYVAEIPSFRQGQPVHELESLVTAEEVSGYVMMIAELTENAKHWEAECRAATIQRDMLGEALSKVFESVIPYREDGSSSIPDSVVEFCNLTMKNANQKWSHEK